METKSLKITKQNGLHKVDNNFAANVQEASTLFTLYVHNKQLFGLKLKEGSDKEVTCIPCI